MNKFWILSFMMVTLLSCNVTSEKKGGDTEAKIKVSSTENEKIHYGLVKIDQSNAVSVKDIITKLDAATELEKFNLSEDLVVEGLKGAKVEGEIIAVCQHKGCWFRMKTEAGQELHIDMKEEKSIPKAYMGKVVVAQGNAYIEKTSVEELQYLAKEEGMTEEEISQITEPYYEYTLLAEGIVLKK